MSNFCGSLRGLTLATRWPRGQNVDFYHLMGAESSRDYVALVTAHVVAAEYFKEEFKRLREAAEYPRVF